MPGTPGTERPCRDQISRGVKSKCISRSFCSLHLREGIAMRTAVLAFVSTVTTLFPFSADAAGEAILYNFTTAETGQSVSHLAWDNGSLFGTATGTGSYLGAFFEVGYYPLKGWAGQTLVAFGSQAWPWGGLIEDSSGNLYGTTFRGGAYNAGTIFKLAAGNWAYSTLWVFGGAGDGASPTGDLTIDSAGNLYGTTDYGGSSGFGAAFKLTPSGGSWSETILHVFQGGNDGTYPGGGLLLDSYGNLFGTTSAGGGAANGGTVYELSPSGGGWTEKVIHRFAGGSDGVNPAAVTLIEDPQGRLYGTTQWGGTYNMGVVFALSCCRDGFWNEQILHNLGGGSDGNIPWSGLTWGLDYNTLYGTTPGGGVYCNCGTLYKLSWNGTSWNETVVFSFGGYGSDGLYPSGAVIRDQNGSLYGTTEEGGTGGYGTVYKITP